jgi:hypothetical protein
MLKSYKLFESPNGITIDGKYIPWFRGNNYTFGYYYNKIFIVRGEETHHDLYYKALNYYREKLPDNVDKDDFEDDFKQQDGLSRINKRSKLSGRLFIKRKIITFWNFPKNNDELKKVVRDIEENTDLEIWDDPDYKIEVIKSAIGDGIYIPINKDNGWFMKEEENLKFIPLKSYNGSEEFSEEEMKKRHVMNPIEKNKLKTKKSFRKDVPLEWKYITKKENYEYRNNYIKKNFTQRISKI